MKLALHAALERQLPANEREDGSSAQVSSLVAIAGATALISAVLVTAALMPIETLWVLAGAGIVLGAQKAGWTINGQAPAAKSQRGSASLASLLEHLPQSATFGGAGRSGGGAAGSGRIILAGCGPGSPELLTIAALRALATADVVISDRIASPELHGLIRPGAELKIAEKIPGNADTAQAELNAWGIDALRAGKTVVRLKAGDPYLYGRAGEEVAFYTSHGFAPHVIPGISSSLLAPLVAGIPVTHRGAANSVLITTGMGRGGSHPALPPYDRDRTLVMLMAVGRIPTLFADLTALGYPPTIAVAIIERAAHPDERITVTDLTRLARDAAAAGVESPAVIIVGRAVNAQNEEIALAIRERAIGAVASSAPAAGDTGSTGTPYAFGRMGPKAASSSAMDRAYGVAVEV